MQKNESQKELLKDCKENRGDCCENQSKDEDIPEVVQVFMQAIHEATEKMLPQIFPCLQKKQPE